MITIVDYGLGNIGAFVNVYARVNIKVSVAKEANELRGATKLILPGVGHFDHAMEMLQKSGMRDALAQLVLIEKIPIIGVCVGMQMLARSSEEGSRPGLGWVSGDVKAFKSLDAAKDIALPHMGWNDVSQTIPSQLFSGIGTDARFYFLHSYYFSCDHPDDILAMCDYGLKFVCAIQHDNIYGVQFHPEKSHGFGSRLLKNFAEL